MGSGFTDKDKGWTKFMTQFRVNSGETAGFVGYLRSSGDYKNEAMRTKEAKKLRTSVKPPEPITMAQLAAVHEMGSSDGTIPQRSFIGSAIDEHSKELMRLTKKATNKVIDGDMSKGQAIGLLCQKVADWIVAKIDSNVPPPLEDATIKRKGSTKTLVDTGQLKGAVDWEIKRGSKE